MEGCELGCKIDASGSLVCAKCNNYYHYNSTTNKCIKNDKDFKCPLGTKLVNVTSTNFECQKTISFLIYFLFKWLFFYIYKACAPRT